MSTGVKLSQKRPYVTFILVHFGKVNMLKECISSIHNYCKEIKYKIIVVDNNPIMSTSDLNVDLYIKAPSNIGYARGNNLGARHADSEYIFILNPDTKFNESIIKKMLTRMSKNRNIAAAGPMLTNNKRGEYLQIGVINLTPYVYLMTSTFLAKIFPNNSVYKKYWSTEKAQIQYVDCIAGSAMLIQKNFFDKIGGMDETFFLYFEEVDLCRRLQAIGGKIALFSDIHLYHEWGASTPKSPKIKKVFQKSRFYYFKKHFGLLNALGVEAASRFSLRSIWQYGKKVTFC